MEQQNFISPLANQSNPEKEEDVSLRINVPEKIEPIYSLEDFATKLSEHIVGLKIDDPTLPDRIIEDQKVIRTKYSLPSLESRSNLTEYERSLLEIAKSTGVIIKSKSECGKFFEDYPYAGGVHFGEEKKVGVDINRTSFESYAKSLVILEHELIHALQKKHSPQMPIELMEYEAYIAGGNNTYIKEHPQIARLVFDSLIGASVRHWYNQTSEERGEEVTPTWL